MIDFRQSGKVANVILSINNVNSLNINALDDLYKIVKLIDYRKTHIVVFSSSMKHFSAGADLKERSKMSDGKTLKFLNKINHIFKYISEIEVPTIALTDGACLGGGLELALACDFIVSSENAMFGFPESSIGIIPGAGGTQRLTRKVGSSKAMKWIFTADKFTAKQAFQEGVVDILSANHKKSLKVFINKILRNSPISIKASKSSIHQAFIDRGFIAERQEYLKTLYSKDRNEGLKAFKEKRNPNWKNK